MRASLLALFAAVTVAPVDVDALGDAAVAVREDGTRLSVLVLSPVDEKLQRPRAADLRAYLADRRELPAAEVLEVARTGWFEARAPYGRLLPPDLTLLDERAMLGPDRKARILAVGRERGDFDPTRPPLLLVHGLNGGPRDLQSVLDRTLGRFQVYVLCYDDFHRTVRVNAEDLASELTRLQRTGLEAGHGLTIVAHSMGGIVTRQALNRTVVLGTRAQGPIHVVAVDTPWHGFLGPADEGLGGAMMAFARPFLPDGLEDMRSRSALFEGDEGLFDVALPPEVRIDLVFAQEGTEALDFTEGALAAMAGVLVEVGHGVRARPADPQVANLLRALQASTAWPAVRDDLARLADGGALDEDSAMTVLRRHYPRFPGDHVSVLGPHGGREDLLGWLDEALGP